MFGYTDLKCSSPFARYVKFVTEMSPLPRDVALYGMVHPVVCCLATVCHQQCSNRNCCLFMMLVRPVCSSDFIDVKKLWVLCATCHFRLCGYAICSRFGLGCYYVISATV